jgi:hypothetical protein
MIFNRNQYTINNKLFMVKKMTTKVGIGNPLLLEAIEVAKNAHAIGSDVVEIIDGLFQVRLNAEYPVGWMLVHKGQFETSTSERVDFYVFQRIS